jgi:hypothetical protein
MAGFRNRVSGGKSSRSRKVKGGIVAIGGAP